MTPKVVQIIGSCVKTNGALSPMLKNVKNKNIAGIERSIQRQSLSTEQQEIIQTRCHLTAYGDARKLKRGKLACTLEQMLHSYITVQHMLDAVERDRCVSSFACTCTGRNQTVIDNVIHWPWSPQRLDNRLPHLTFNTIYVVAKLQNLNLGRELHCKPRLDAPNVTDQWYSRAAKYTSFAEVDQAVTEWEKNMSHSMGKYLAYLYYHCILDRVVTTQTNGLHVWDVDSTTGIPNRILCEGILHPGEIMPNRCQYRSCAHDHGTKTDNDLDQECIGCSVKEPHQSRRHILTIANSMNTGQEEHMSRYYAEHDISDDVPEIVTANGRTIPRHITIPQAMLYIIHRIIKQRGMDDVTTLPLTHCGICQSTVDRRDVSIGYTLDVLDELQHITTMMCQGSDMMSDMDDVTRMNMSLDVVSFNDIRRQYRQYCQEHAQDEWFQDMVVVEQDRTTFGH